MAAGTHPAFGTFRINAKGYLRINSGEHRGKYLHRAVFEKVAGRAVREGFEVHHMNGQRCFCPHQLVELQAELHSARLRPRDPFTGAFVSMEEYIRKHGQYP